MAVWPWRVPAWLAVLALIGCAGQATPGGGPGPQGAQRPVDWPAPVWEIYSPDPGHLWNRLYRGLYERTADEGAYGADALDPPLWPDSAHLLAGESHQQAVALLDEFLASGGEGLIDDPLKRALLQRDLWAVFDWAGAGSDGHAAGRLALRRRLAQAIRRLALSREQIAALADNYRAAGRSPIYPTEYRQTPPGAAYMPGGLFDPGQGWVVLGRHGGPSAMSHTQEFPFLGRSVFVVLLRVPGGRADTLEFVNSLNELQPPPLPAGLEAALARLMLAINERQALALTPLVESVQVRYFPGTAPQQYYSFSLNRAALLAETGGGLQAVTEDYRLFFQGSDLIEAGQAPKGGIPGTCIGCHQDDGADVYGVRSLLAYSRARFDLPGGERPLLSEGSLDGEAQAVMEWKRANTSWEALQTMLMAAAH